MISIRRLMNRGEDDAVLWQAICLLLEKIGSEAIVGDRAEYEVFCKNLEKIGDSVASVASPESLLVTIGSAVQAMSDHKQRVSKFIQRQRSEIQTMVAMLTDTVVKLGGENTRFAQSFQEIGARLQSAVALQDLQEIKVHLKGCLQDLQDETRKRKAEMDGVITTLQQEVERSVESAGQPDIDPATGLPGQEAAEAAMLEGLKSAKRKFVATVVISRMQSINARFGYQVGDQVLRTCREKVEKELSPGDQMFRWTGPALILLLERADTLEVVRGQLKRILDTRIEETYSLGSRAVLIPITTAWSAFKLVSPVSIAVRQIQTFIASQSPRDFA